MTTGLITMPRSKAIDRVKKEVETPRPRNGNTYAVGAYLEKLREAAGYHREPLVRQILNEMHGNITMSMSTLGMIETGRNKSVGGATIDAVRRAVGGDPYDISELYRLPIPSEDDEAGIEACRDEGIARAIIRRQRITGGSGIKILAENSTPRVEKILNNVASSEQLLTLLEQLSDDPKAIKIVQAVLEARKSN